MDPMSAFAMGEANRGKESMVFDWLKAAKIISEKKPNQASAGLKGDWNWTGGCIYKDGEVYDEYTYLSSTWATPQLNVDGEIIDCFVMGSETEWDSSTKWPREARDIVEKVIDGQWDQKQREEADEKGK